MESLLELDRIVLLAVNGLHSPFLDELMIFVSQKWVWLPVYAGLFTMLIWLKGWKNAGIILLFAALLILIADQGASGFFKRWVQRPRPCHVGDLKIALHLVGGKCGGPYGFISSHAANFFALAGFLWFLFRSRFPRSWIWFFGVASLVAFSRVYLGAHYPGDVIAGALWGLFSAFLVVRLIRKISPKIQ